MRLYICHRSSSSVGMRVTYPSPQTFLIALRQIFISHEVQEQRNIVSLKYIWMLSDQYEMLKGYENNQVTIGFGSYGQVKLARCLNNQEIVAVKIVRKIAKNEVKMHNQLHHRNIIRLLDCQFDEEREVTYMILEYAEGGTLFEQIKMTSLLKASALRYFQEVCEAVAYLHSQDIMHRDIKPQNILIKEGHAKLCDFGFAALLGERKTLCGTYEYMSPEMIQNKQYDYKIDVWALGILLFQMISGHAPFRGERPEEVLEQMKTKIYFCDKFDQSQIQLIKLILRVSPQKRPTVQEILNHPCLKPEKAKSIPSTLDFVRSRPPVQTFLSDSMNSKRMNQIQRNISKEFQKLEMAQKPANNIPYQKLPQNSYPFYIPKGPNRMGTGVTVTTPGMQVSHLQQEGSGHLSRTAEQHYFTPHHEMPPFKASNSTLREETYRPAAIRTHSPLNYRIVNAQMHPHQIMGPQEQISQQEIKKYPVQYNGNIGFGRYS